MDFLLQTVAPTVGTIVSIVMYGTPVSAALNVKRTGQLGGLNPVPFAAMVAVTAGWVAYASVKENYFVLLANGPGLIIGVFLVMSLQGFASRPVQDTMVYMMCAGALYFVIAAVLTVYQQMHDQDIGFLWGFAAVILQVLYYAAPLSTFGEVISKKSSASLYPPGCFMNTVNSALWAVYGIAIGDTFVWSPNVIGVILGGASLVLCAVFPREERATVSSSQGGSRADDASGDSQLSSAETGSASNPSQPLLRKSRS
ncbi:hypothetical protein WJX74_000479 [Apatococcus lobatus]|uniref:Bidirectional sugar transporter SWEET n=1 Tax=Apatococcus lobatus TaxID=904363 RepID=A0AAW1S5U1_9CHLO